MIFKVAFTNLQTKLYSRKKFITFPCKKMFLTNIFKQYWNTNKVFLCWWHPFMAFIVPYTFNFFKDQPALFMYITVYIFFLRVPPCPGIDHLLHICNMMESRGAHRPWSSHELINSSLLV